ncbi:MULTISPECIES: outer membrane lipoprotein carrier protein LolA [unclassified Acinetobacter]|uniref:outer membrane lipoprotein carrier protein LolA n=1 Tax=unclassified Acinetobacter TaxID=196816 RepID=UPI002934C1F7|nr:MULTISPECIES: outer membrane lipoprotein carrier protein LolA [unclassified Acinetobacter]WOE31255.1 outer membrane lipoprotein carrier protein LolA [Acinetobacter sp. SAAs470]WOE39451.1 outer membrane lipoprotein carrier protein LolA [Acinetobacter sp. SAAs474]
MAIIASSMSLVYAGQSNAQKIFQQLSAMPLVRADFEQRKKLSTLNKTYISKGTVLFAKNYGVLWQIQTPVKADLIVTAQKLVQKTQRTYSQIEINKTPYGSVATMFLQLMSGNEVALAKNFNIVSAKYTPVQWRIVLTPKSSLFKKLFDQVDIQGQRYVDEVLIQEKAGNTTQIIFSQQTSQPNTLMATEHALFQLAK